MSTRFDSRKNNPNSQTLSSKRKVLREFQKMQQQLQSIEQEFILPEGEEFFEEDAVPVTSLVKDPTPDSGSQVLNKIWENEEYFTKRDQENIEGIKQKYRSLEPASDRGHTKRKMAQHEHRFANSQFSTMNTFHQTMIQPRSTGFIDFDLQTKRPAFPVHKAHEHRFQYLNHFPNALSTQKHVPKFDFNKQVSRKEERGISMSESCFSHEKVDFIRKRAKGLLHFGKSSDVKMVSVMPRKWHKDGLGAHQKGHVTVLSPQVKFDRQMLRVPNFSMMSKTITREDKRAMNKLPSHMHNVNNRMACTNTLERTLRESKYQHADFMDPKTNLADRTSFRQDPLNGSPPPLFDPQKPPKKKMTFSQLLVKFGYITADKNKEQRKRPWHVTPINPDGYSSSSDDENVGI